MRTRTVGILVASLALSAAIAPPRIRAQSRASGLSSDVVASCEALQELPRLTIISARVVDSDVAGPYCHVRGIIPPAIGFHVQLPLPPAWNGRFLKWGDGGKDGDLDYADHRVAEGYAVANSNTGHDNGAEPGSSFGWNNRQAEIDFGYRAVHLTAVAGKTVTRAYYGRDPEYSYFEGCSTGGRQGLMEAQRFPEDFDGIVAGAPANHYQPMNAVRVWLLQRMFRDDFTGALAYDTDGDGRFDSVRKIELLADAVLDACDATDGIEDGVIDDPTQCDFDPSRDLAALQCPDARNADGCFTSAQIQTIHDFYSGPTGSDGRTIYAGKPLGSERQWASLFIPYPGNRFAPGAVGLGADHLNYLFYETDPGVPPSDLLDTSRPIDRDGMPPQWAWWEFDIADVTRGKGDFMSRITDATDPDLSRFLVDDGGKLLLYHGWADALVVPQPTVAYYEELIDTTFDGDLEAARHGARLFMAPGMGHCRGGSGPDTWDRLAPLVAWVEDGRVPDRIVATHQIDDRVDNERPLCPYPEHAVYSGPAADRSDPRHWIADNFECR